MVVHTAEVVGAPMTPMNKVHHYYTLTNIIVLHAVYFHSYCEIRGVFFKTYQSLPVLPCHAPYFPYME